MSLRAFTLQVAFLSACGPAKTTDPCAAYTEALDACAAAAGVEPRADGAEINVCEQRSGEPSPAYFDCVTEALEGADCSTTEGIRAASAATAPCRALLTFTPVEEGFAGEAPVPAERR
jgi:hypothetical protein